MGSLGFASQALSATSARTDSCFLARDWEGWKSPSPNVIYIRVGVSRIYQIDLSAGSNQLQEPDMHLVNRIRGSDWICDPLDLQLQLADNHGAFAEPLFVKSITKLTPEQVAAIPKKFLP
ncbi:MAG: hypothetical protein WDM85_06025 [Caulobacteraceae bacterium]